MDAVAYTWKISGGQGLFPDKRWQGYPIEGSEGEGTQPCIVIICKYA